MQNQIVAAIRSKTVLRVTYYPGVRIIEPHAFGVGSDGQLLLRAYQKEGASESGEHANWKLFRYDRIQDLFPLAENFSEPRAGYKKGDRVMKGGIIAEL